MKKASEIMFKIGNIFTIIYLILGGILFIVGLISSIAAGVAIAGAPDEGAAAAAAAALGSAIGLIFLGIYFFVTSLICLIVGAIASNYFYVLAGIFGLIAEGQQGQKAE